MRFQAPLPRVGVSACLLGQPLRHDGRHKRHAYVADELGALVTLVGVCPEAEFGLRTPRPAMHLRLQGGAPRLVVTGSGEDLTTKMTQFTQGRLRADDLAALCGYVFKARSPSCGLWSVDHFHDPSALAAGSPLVAAAHQPGLFAAALRARWPELPVVEEADLGDPEERDFFLSAVHAYHRAQAAALK